jgi:hypothetical protein
VQKAKQALEAKYAGDVPLEPLPEGGCRKDLTETDGAATCGWFSKCGKSRNADCVDGHCQCAVGSCSSGAAKAAKCVENESAMHAEEVRCVTDLTETDKSATCSMFSGCKKDRLAKCKNGKCTCDGGKICSNRNSKFAQCVWQKVPTPFPAPGPPTPKPTVAPCVTDLTTTDSKATCGWFSCNSKRNAVCRGKKCTCEGGCSNMASSSARCIPQVLGGGMGGGGHSFLLNSDGTVAASATEDAHSLSSGSNSNSAVAIFAAAGVAALVVVAAAMFAVTRRVRLRSGTQSQPVTPATSIPVENINETASL